MNSHAMGIIDAADRFGFTSLKLEAEATLVNTTEFVNRKCKRASPLRSDSNRIALCC
jgi:hypothetical protein